MTETTTPLDNLYGFTDLVAPNGQKLRVRVILTRKNSRALGVVTREIMRLRGELSAISAELIEKNNDDTLEADVDRVESLDEKLCEVMWTGVQLLVMDPPAELADAESAALANVFATAVAAQRDSAQNVIARRTGHPLSE